MECSRDKNQFVRLVEEAANKRCIGVNSVEWFFCTWNFNHYLFHVVNSKLIVSCWKYKWILLSFKLYPYRIHNKGIELFTQLHPNKHYALQWHKQMRSFPTAINWFLITIHYSHHHYHSSLLLLYCRLACVEMAEQGPASVPWDNIPSRLNTLLRWPSYQQLQINAGLHWGSCKHHPYYVQQNRFVILAWIYGRIYTEI